jgi:hypothetical protein
MQREAKIHWQADPARAEIMRGTDDDQAAYAAGWTISGLATLTAIVAVWVFGICGVRVAGRNSRRVCAKHGPMTG